MTLTRPVILAGARTLVERDGYAALTMRRLADELGSAPMSLYRHVADKAELVHLLLDESVPPVAVDPALPPRERVVDALNRVHGYLAATPWVVDVLADGTLWAARSTDLAEAVTSAFVELGLSAPEAAAAYGSLWSHLLGAMVVHHWTSRDPEGVTPAVVAARRAEHPLTTQVLQERAGLSGNARYAWALPRLVDGLSGRMSR